MVLLLQTVQLLVGVWMAVRVHDTQCDLPWPGLHLLPITPTRRRTHSRLSPLGTCRELSRRRGAPSSGLPLSSLPTTVLASIAPPLGWSCRRAAWVETAPLHNLASPLDADPYLFGRTMDGFPACPVAVPAT